MYVFESICLAIIVYILIGVILDHCLTYSMENEPYVLMVFYWPLVLTIVWIAWVCMKCGELWKRLRKKPSIRDNMLVTMGARAAYMDHAGVIDIPSGVDGEDQLSNFVVTTVKEYISSKTDIPFDEYIEMVLTDEYGKERT